MSEAGKAGGLQASQIGDFKFEIEDPNRRSKLEIGKWKLENHSLGR
jgi:hypothetical protein